jgi:hypothetical protein
MDVAITTNNLAGVLFDLRYVGEAIRLYRRVLDLQRKLFGGDNPATLATLTSLAMAQHQMGTDPRRTQEVLQVGRLSQRSQHVFLRVAA